MKSLGNRIDCAWCGSKDTERIDRGCYGLGPDNPRRPDVYRCQACGCDSAHDCYRLGKPKTTKVAKAKPK